MLTYHLPGLDPTLKRIQGSLIASHIGEFAIYLKRDRDAKALYCKSDKEKGIPDLLGYNLTYLLRLGQVDAHKNLPVNT